MNDPLEQAPPTKLVERQVLVQTQGSGSETVINTIRMPNAPRHAESSRWYNPSGTQDTAGSLMPKIHERNEVTYLIDGKDVDGNTQGGGGSTVKTLQKMREAIESAKNEDDFIYLLNWWCDDSLDMGGKTLRQLLKNASDAGVEVRAVFWLQKQLSLGLIVHYLVPVIGAVLPDSVQAIAQAIDFVGNLESLGISAVQNNREVVRINLMKNGAAILDDRTLDFGSHHQKVLIVKNQKEIVAFCGGIDFNKDRIEQTKSPSSSSGGKGEPLHDVHCQIRGPAVVDLLRTFVERWEDFEKKKFDLETMLKNFAQGVAGDFPDMPFDALVVILQEKLNKPLRGRKFLKPEHAPDPAGEQFVQIGRTYGDGDDHAGIDQDHIPGHEVLAVIPILNIPVKLGEAGLRFARPKGYSFRPKGEQTARALIAHAINQARRFIYIEDQYFTNPEITRLLIAALDRGVEHITILIPHGSISDQPDGRFHRHHGLKPLLDRNKKDGVKRVRVYCRAAPHDPSVPLKSGQQEHVTQREGRSFRVDLAHTYIHAKCIIIDDRFASIGSVNCNVRSWTHDSEITAGIFDESHDDKMTLHFAHRLRIKLWAEHLRMDTPQGHAELWDGVASAIHWDRLPPITRVIPYIDPDRPDEDALQKHRMFDKLQFLEKVPIIGLLSNENVFHHVVDPDGSVPGKEIRLLPGCRR